MKESDIIKSLAIIVGIAERGSEIAECEKSLSKHLGRGVKIVNGKRKGRFELEFYGQDDLQVLLDALMKIER